MNDKDVQKKRMGSRIKMIRKKMGQTMKEFGQNFDPPASDSIVSRWERGVSEPNNERLKRIAELGNISLFYLTAGEKGISDFSRDDMKKIASSFSDKFDLMKKNQNKYIKNEIEKIDFDDLDFIESSYFTNVLKFLKFSDKSDIHFLTAFIVTLNNNSKLENNDLESLSDLERFIEETVHDVEEFLRKRFTL